jgi:mRNA-degrading endonuclease RelE of RelBE toxin-antitoxin system
MTEPRWRLVVAPAAVRALDRLPEKAAGAIVEFMLGPLSDNPRQVGHALRRELEGLHSARRGPYRVIYEIVEAAAEIHVLRIDHRADVYRRL